MTLPWGNYPGLSGGANVIAMFLKVESLSRLQWAGAGVSREAGLAGTTLLAWEMGEGGRDQGMQRLL